MKISITTKQELQNPYLELNINLETGAITSVLRYTCIKCNGDGCINECNDSQELAIEDIIKTLGSDSRKLLKQAFDKILDGAPILTKNVNNNEKNTYIIIPIVPSNDPAYDLWFSSFLTFIEKNSDDITFKSHMRTIGIITVKSSNAGVRALKQAGYTVEANGTLHI